LKNYNLSIKLRLTDQEKINNALNLVRWKPNMAIDLMESCKYHENWEERWNKAAKRINDTIDIIHRTTKREEALHAYWEGNKPRRLTLHEV